MDSGHVNLPVGTFVCAPREHASVRVDWLDRAQSRSPLPGQTRSRRKLEQGRLRTAERLARLWPQYGDLSFYDIAARLGKAVFVRPAAPSTIYQTASSA